MVGFEPTASHFQGGHSGQTELHPDWTCRSDSNRHRRSCSPSRSLSATASWGGPGNRTLVFRFTAGRSATELGPPSRVKRRRAPPCISGRVTWDRTKLGGFGIRNAPRAHPSQTGAGSRNRTLFVGLQDRSIASYAYPAWYPRRDSNSQ